MVIERLGRVAHGLVTRSMRAVFFARRTRARMARALDGRMAERELSAGTVPTANASAQRRNILFITVDQQHYDALGINGGRIARTPRLDAIGRSAPVA